MFNALFLKGAKTTSQKGEVRESTFAMAFGILLGAEAVRVVASAERRVLPEHLVDKRCPCAARTAPARRPHGARTAPVWRPQRLTARVELLARTGTLDTCVKVLSGKLSNCIYLSLLQILPYAEVANICWT